MIRRLIAVLLLFVLVSGSASAATSKELEERRIETENGYRIEYLDAFGTVTFATDKQYAAINRIIENGMIAEEYYFDAEGKATKVSGSYGEQKRYDENGRCVEIVYVDVLGKPMNNSSGYAILKREYDEKGRIVLDRYYDENRNPQKLNGGQYGLRRDEFDEKDRVVRFTYVGKNNEPILLLSGYSGVIKIYDEHETSHIEMFLNTDGELMKVPGGYWGVLYNQDKSGKHLGSTFLDQKGNPIEDRRGVATTRYEYDEWDNIVKYSYYNLKGEPTDGGRGRYGQVIEYKGKTLVRSYFVDAEGRELFMPDIYLAQNTWLNVLAVVLFFWLCKVLPKKVKIGLLVLYCAFIFYMTLVVRESGDSRAQFELFWSYRQFFSNAELKIEIIHNILLFVPLGMLAMSLTGKWSSMLWGIGLSVAIELVQYVFGLGLCELDDVVSNGLGMAIGCVVMKVFSDRRSVLSIRKRKNFEN